MIFHMYAKVKMNREVNPDTDYLSAGGYTIRTDRGPLTFDFEEYAIKVDTINPSIIHIQSKHPDEQYQDTKRITADDLKTFSKFEEFFIFTGEPYETDLKPVALLECEFSVFISNEWVDIEIPSHVCTSAQLCSNID